MFNIAFTLLYYSPTRSLEAKFRIVLARQVSLCRPLQALATMSDHFSGSSQATSEEESPPPQHPEVQKKPAGRKSPKSPEVRNLIYGRKKAGRQKSSKSSKVQKGSPTQHPNALAVDGESESGGTQVTSESDLSQAGRSRVTKQRKADQLSSSSCETPETKRIKAAQHNWEARPKLKSKSKPAAPKGTESSMEETSDSSDATDLAQTEIPKPTSSGLLDWCSWMVDQLSPEERECAATNWWETFGEFCGGMGTGIICFEGLRRAMATHDLKVRTSCMCQTEKVPWKAKALSELDMCLQEQTSPCCIISRTSDLSDIIIKNFKGEVVLEKPTFTLLLNGIVCIDISTLTTTPKSVMDLEGESGRSVREMLMYLESLSFKERPECIILECVLRLLQKRTKGLPKPEVGTELITAALRPLGYIGAWEQANAIKTYLPQSRARAWAIYLKVKMNGPNPFEAEVRTRADISKALSIARRLRVPKHEPLQAIVSRWGLTAPPSPNANLKLSLDFAWTSNAPSRRSMNMLGITPEDLVSDDLKAFMEESSTLMNQSQQRNVLMRLASLKKKGKVPDWREAILVFNADESAHRLAVGINHFPCVQPTRLHILAWQGKLVKADGRLCLAVQGIQPNELAAFPALSKQTSKRQQSWAGNGFTANVCASYILAAAIVR